MENPVGQQCRQSTKHSLVVRYTSEVRSRLGRIGFKHAVWMTSKMKHGQAKLAYT